MKKIHEFQTKLRKTRNNNEMKKKQLFANQKSHLMIWKINSKMRRKKENKFKQAGAELCQAQGKLRLVGL